MILVLILLWIKYNCDLTLYFQPIIFILSSEIYCPPNLAPTTFFITSISLTFLFLLSTSLYSFSRLDIALMALAIVLPSEFLSRMTYSQAFESPLFTASLETCSDFRAGSKYTLNSSEGSPFLGNLFFSV